MQVPLQISWRNLEKSDAVEAEIHRRMAKLEKLENSIISCRVVVEQTQKRHHKGNLFHVGIDLRVPDREIVVARDPAADHSHEDIYVSIRDAFNAIKRRLQDYARERQGQIKAHEIVHQARVKRRFPAQGYGFLETPDGREIYFDRNAVDGMDFDMLDEGTEVGVVEEQGEKGPQAVRVLTGKHRSNAL